MKTIFTTFCLLISVAASYAQETMEVRSKLTKKITAIYHVLVSGQQIKQGLYQVLHDKNLALASGSYTNNKKTGTWHYFDYRGNLVQNYNYDLNHLTYEAPDEAGGFKYMLDEELKSTDTITKPIKVGGRYFGYLPLLILFKKPDNLQLYGSSGVPANIELLISPAGNLADYTVHLQGSALNLNLNLLSQEDKTFIPASINGKSVPSRILIPAYIDLSGNLVIN